MTARTTHTRRDVLAGAGVICGTLATGGCIDVNRGGSGPPAVDASFRLTSIDLRNGLRVFAVDPVEIEANYEIDYSEGYKRAKFDELVGSGTVSARAWPLSWRSPWGDGYRDKRRVLRYDGTYYRVQVAEEEPDVARERQVLFLDWTADAPGDDVRTHPVEALSERDREIFDAAAESVPASGRRLEDPVDYGVVFHDDLDAEESDLVPDPPFDYLEVDGETFAVRAQTIDHERTERTFSAEAVAESESEYLEYARTEFPDAVFADVDLSSGARGILRTATHPDGRFYEEEPPLSDDLEAVLEHLGIADELRPHEAYEERVVFRNALAKHGGRWYRLHLQIYP